MSCREEVNKKVLHPAHKETATKETIEHYKRCKRVILSLCKQDDSIRSLIGDHWRWYNVDWERRKAWLWIANGENYDFLTQNYRTLYWTLQLWIPEIKNKTRSWLQKPTGKWGINKLKEGALGTRKETRLMGLSVDIDKAKGKEVTDPNVKKWLEAVAKFFADYFKSIGFQSYALFFSGGGVYVMLHPALTTIGENEKHDVVFRWEVVQKCFDLFIMDMEKRFFATYSEAKQWVKGFDRLNYDGKRQFKTPLSIHKKYPYAVIPLDKENPVIDFDKARLPISNELIEETAKCFTFVESDIERLGKNVFALYGDQAKKEIEEKHPLNQSFDARPDVEELDVSKWSPCARNIYGKAHFDGPGATRSLAFLANYMRFVGVPREKAYQIFIKKASEWDAETSNIFESWFDCDGELHCFIPSCEHFNIEGSGFPNMEFGGLGFCTPDGRCNEIKHPLQYHKKEEKEAQIPLKYKDKDFGVLQLEKVKDDKHVLITIRSVDKLEVFEAKKPLDFYFSEKIRDTLFGFIKSELKDEYTNFLSEIIPQIRDRLRPKPKEEKLGINHEEDFNEEIKEAALNLLKDPAFFFKVREFLEKHGKINNYTKKVIIGEDDNKLLLFCVGLCAKYHKKLNAIIQGESSSGKSRLLYLYFLLFKNDVIDLFRASERAIDHLSMDLEGKIIVIKELEGGKSAIYSIKIVIDPESDRLTLWTVEKDEKTNEQITVQKTVQGHPIFVSTTTDVQIDAELKNRIFLVAMDDSEVQTKRIAKVDDEERSGFFPDITDELNVFRCAIQMLRPLQVKIPFSIEYPTKHVKSRRSRAHLLDLIEVVAFAHQYQRDIIKVKEPDGNEYEYIIATPGDFEVAYEIAKRTIERDIQEVHPKALKLFELFKHRGFEVNGEKGKVGFTLKKVRELSPEYLGRSYSKTFIRGLLDELDGANYIVSDGGKPKKWYILDEENDGECTIIDSVHVRQPFGETELRAWLNRIITTDTTYSKDMLTFSLSHHIRHPFSQERIPLLNTRCLLCSSERSMESTPHDRTNNGECTLSQSDDFPPSFADNAEDKQEEGRKEEKSDKTKKDKPTRYVNNEDLDEGDDIKREHNPKTPSKEQINDLKEIFKKNYEYKNGCKCEDCGRRGIVFVYLIKKGEKKLLCAACLGKEIKARGVYPSS